MCIAIIKQKNVDLPDLTIFSNSFANNPHGAGYVVNKDGINYIYKGFESEEELYESCKEHVSKFDTAIFHFRFATHGVIDIHNCHPFFCSDKSELHNIDKNGICSDCEAMVHNGVFNIHTLNNDSDSITIAKLLSNSKNKLSHQKMIESNNKVAIMKLNGDVEIYGNWMMENQIIYSNGTYRFDCNMESKKQNINFMLCDVCGNIGENYITTEVGYHFCKYCNDVVVNWHKCKKCGKKTTDIYCNECFHKYNLEESYFED